jgi:deoxyxylulose-5-phosphate synthase
VLEQVGGSVPVVRFGLPDAFVPHGDRTLLLEDLGLTPRAVAAAAAALRPAALARVK